MLTRHPSIFRSIPLAVALGLGLSAGPAHAQDAGPGPLTGAKTIEISIADKGQGELGLLLPLPERKRGDLYPWSEAEVSRVRDGESGFCRVRVRRGHDDPAHDLELEIKCAHRTGSKVHTDLRLETIHTMGKRKKAVLAEFRQPDGSATKVTLTAK